jgi:hypothetical protein
MLRTRTITAAALLLSGCGTYNLVLDDANNYSFTTSLTADEVAVADCPEDLTMDWSGLTSDLLGHEMDPTTDIDTMRVVRFYDMEPQAVLDAISVNELSQSDISGNVDYTPTAGETQAMLSEFVFNGTPIDPATEVCSELGATFLFTALTGLYEYRMLMFFSPTPEETNTEVSMDGDSAQLQLDVDLSAGGVIEVPANREILIDWIGLTIDGQGNPFSVSNIDRLMLARYELSVEEMEQQFLDLQIIPDEMYTANIGGIGEFELSGALDADGEAFTGFDGEGLWLLGLFCTTCANPAPLYLAVIEAG